MFSVRLMRRGLGSSPALKTAWQPGSGSSPPVTPPTYSRTAPGGTGGRLKGIWTIFSR